jgi:xylulokinase
LKTTGPHVLGIDVGTSACKAALLGPSGEVISAQSDPYGFQAPKPDWAEQDPAVWRSGAAASAQRVCSNAGCRLDDVVAIGVTGQMHTAVLLGSDDEVLRPALLWSDQRAGQECELAEASFPEIREITLNPLLPAFTLSKLLWLRKHEPELHARIRRVLLPKDYLRHLLTEVVCTDPSDAAGTGMFDARSWRWSDEILAHFDIPLDSLPPCVASSEVVGVTTVAGGDLLGLPQGVPVVAGAGDQAAQAVGLGAVEPSIVGVQLGTSAVVVRSSEKAVAGAFCHGVPERWLRLNSIHAGALSLSWVRDAFAPDRSLDSLLEDASEVEPGYEGLLFLPFLLGERAGFDSSLPGVLYGLRLGHALPHVVRAVLEGVAFELHRMTDEWEPEADELREIRLVGGGSQSQLWQQIVADVFARPVVHTNRDSAFGAAAIAGRAIGWWDGLPGLTNGARIEPDPALAATYRDRYRDYRALFRSLRRFAHEEGG